MLESHRVGQRIDVSQRSTTKFFASFLVGEEKRLMSDTQTMIGSKYRIAIAMHRAGQCDADLGEINFRVLHEDPDAGRSAETDRSAVDQDGVQPRVERYFSDGTTVVRRDIAALEEKTRKFIVIAIDEFVRWRGIACRQ